MLQTPYRNLWDLEPRRNLLQRRTDEYKGNATVWSLILVRPEREDHVQTETKSSVVSNNEILSSVFLYNMLVKTLARDVHDTVRKNIFNFIFSSLR